MTHPHLEYNRKQEGGLCYGKGKGGGSVEIHLGQKGTHLHDHSGCQPPYRKIQASAQ